MKLIPVTLLLLALTLFTSCSKSNTPSSMLSLSEDERRVKIAEDLELVRRYDQGLEDVIRYAKGHPELFPKREDRMLRPEEKQALRRIFQTMLDYMRALDGIKSYWRDFHRYGMIKQRRAHAEAFFVGYNAWLVQYKHGLDFIDLTVPSKPMEKLLDEGSPEFDIPAGAFGQLKWNVIHVKSIARLLGSEQYFKTVAPALTDADCQKNPTCAWALTNTAAHASASIAQLADRAAIQFSYNTFDIARDFTFDRWFPLQRNVAEWMGDTKVRRLHTHLIRDEDLTEVAKLSEPGDIMVSRHNWYLSNVGLPGLASCASVGRGSGATRRFSMMKQPVRASGAVSP
ncbi:MAG: hypothetical protein R3E66_15590 [bacterium]